MLAKTPYLIAETAYNHEGDFSYLLKMIDGAHEAGADAVKFHLLLNLAQYLQDKHALNAEMPEWLFSKTQWSEIFAHTAQKNMDIIALCDDTDSVEWILDTQPKRVAGIEIHATGLNDYFLLQPSAKFSGTVILGIGGSTIEEIQYAIDLLKAWGKDDIFLIYGFQNYPTNYEDINLAKIAKIQNIFNLPVGYADHTAFDNPHNLHLSCLPAAMGITVLEKHFTLDPGKKRLDYHAAISIEDLKKIKELFDISVTAYGTGEISMSDAELAYGNTGPMKKAVVARRPIKKGAKIVKEDVWFKRTVEESTIRQNQFFQLIGQEASVDIAPDEIIDTRKIAYQFKKTTANDFLNV